MSRLARGEIVFPKLREVQQREGCISSEALGRLSRELNLPLHHLQGLVSFFPSFSSEPSRPLRVRVCRDLSCHLAGSQRLLQEGLRAARQRDDVEICDAPCLGRCEQAVALEANGRVHGRASAGLLRQILAGSAPEVAPAEAFPQKAARCEPYDSTGEWFAGFRACLEGGREVEEVLQAVRDSGLRGMGGAGFSTGLKWQIVRGAKGAPKYVICNADESEPGTSKDRVILERWPHLVLEGMLVCMWAVGAEEGWIYLRHEYLEPARRLEELIRSAFEQGLLGQNAGGSGRRLEVRLFESPGGYICGEETALLEVMEGRRAEPRNKPPFPGTHGLWNRPTVINNVETFTFVPAILKRGPGWFAAQGQNGARGLKFLALSGHVQRPGVYEVPLGITARSFIDEFGQGVQGSALKAFAPGGASSGFLPARELDTPLDFDALVSKGSMLGSGAVVAIAEGTDMVELALSVTRFFRDESCGKCVPCREGTSRAVQMLQARTKSAASGELGTILEELSQAMALTSICGLGQVALNALLSVKRHWPEEWARSMGR
ncbi:MAG: NADH-ubiquinone oxidoreductase-F iron-sulfur binding region domain-containing protein [Acidobacteriota bacterium]